MNSDYSIYINYIQYTKYTLLQLTPGDISLHTDDTDEVNYNAAAALLMSLKRERESMSGTSPKYELADPSSCPAVSKRPCTIGLNSNGHAQWQIDILNEWLMANKTLPYPNYLEKEDLRSRTNFTLRQINNWFSNARRRKLKKSAYRRPLKHKGIARVSACSL